MGPLPPLPQLRPAGHGQAPPPPPRCLKEGWLKCRAAPEDGEPAAPFEDFWCSLGSDGVFSFHRQAGGSAAPAVSLQLSGAQLEEHPGAAPGDRGLTQLGFGLRCRPEPDPPPQPQQPQQPQPLPRLSLQLRAASVRERAVWLAALTAHLAAPRRPLFAFMDEASYRSLPRSGLGLGLAPRAVPVAPSPSLRGPGRASVGGPVAAGRGAAAAAAAAGAGGGPPLRRRGSLRELVRRAVGHPRALSWTRLPEVAGTRLPERLGEQQLLLESLRFSLVTSEVAYNGELAELAALARRSVGWRDPLPAYNRRTIAAVVEKVKKCSDNIVTDLEHIWQRRLTFDGVFIILQKHMEKFDIFITYCSHLHELSNIINGAKIQKSEVATQAYSKMYDIERVFLPLLRLASIRKILQEMRGVLVAAHSHLDHFHCKRTLSQITEVLEECYKVLTAASSSEYVSSLDKKLDECCATSIQVTFPEIYEKSEKSPTTSKSPVNISSQGSESSRHKFSGTRTQQGKVSGLKHKGTTKSPLQPKKHLSSSKMSLSVKNSENDLKHTTVSGRETCQYPNRKIKQRCPKGAQTGECVVSPAAENTRNEKKVISSLPYASPPQNKIRDIEKHLSINPKHLSLVDIPIQDSQNGRTGISLANKHEPCESDLRPINYINEDNESVSSGSVDANGTSVHNYNHKKGGSQLHDNHNEQPESSIELYEDTDCPESSETENISCDSSETIINFPPVRTKSSNECLPENKFVYDYPEERILTPTHNKTEQSELEKSIVAGPEYRSTKRNESAEHVYEYVYICSSGDRPLPMKPTQSDTHSRTSSNGIHSSEIESSTIRSEAFNDESNSDNVYEDVIYVDMKPQVPMNSSRSRTPSIFSGEFTTDYDTSVYVKPDVISLRSSSERSRYSSDSGNLDETCSSHTYYNSVKNDASLSITELEFDDTRNESDSAIESGSDTGKFHRAKLQRSPSNASITLQNMVRWRNAQPLKQTPPTTCVQHTKSISSLDSPFEDAPLYQEYYDIGQQKKIYGQENERKVSDDETSYVYIDPHEHVYETLGDYLRSRNMIPVGDMSKYEEYVVQSDNKRTQWSETEEVIESGLLDGMSLDQRRLQEAKFEVITSEVSFLKSLNILEKYFINNIDLNSKDVLSEEEKRTLFLPVAPVKETSQCFLQDLVKVWEDDIFLRNKQLGNVLLKYATGRFRVYIAYCSRQVDINVALMHLREKNKKFVEIIEKIEAKAVCQAFTLQSFLTQPMQRVTRFPMLVKAILRHLPEEDETFTLWQHILDTLQTVVKECNEAVRNAERTLAQKREENKKKAFWSKFQNKR